MLNSVDGITKPAHDAPVPTCRGPECERAPHAHGLCPGHLAQERRGQPLRPLEARNPGRVVLSIRVPAAVKVRALADPDGARAALERWARSRRRDT
jgi:hypothetical protein